MKKVLYILSFFFIVTTMFAQVKNVHDKHMKKIVTEADEKNEPVLKEIIKQTAKANVLLELTNDSLNVVYKQERLKWNDRNNDIEFGDMKNYIQLLRKKIDEEIAKFNKNNVPLVSSLKIFNELVRIDEKKDMISSSHLDNKKRKEAFEETISDYEKLFDSCDKINIVYTTLSKYKGIGNN